MRPIGKLLIRRAAWLCALSLLACGCGEDDPVSHGNAGATGGSDGVAGGTDGGAGGDGVAGFAGTAAGDAGAAGEAAVAGAAGSAGLPSNEGPPYTRECTPEQPWLCRVCDVQTTCEAPTYTDNGDGTVTSSCCGLVWQRDIEWVDDPTLWANDCRRKPEAAACHNFEDAPVYCAGLSLAGGGWRVPVANEIATLFVRDKGSPYIDTTAFPDPPIDDMYWTASPVPYRINHAWVVGFGGTFTREEPKSREHFVRCVR